MIVSSVVPRLLRNSLYPAELNTLTVAACLVFGSTKAACSLSACPYLAHIAFVNANGADSWRRQITTAESWSDKPYAAPRLTLKKLFDQKIAWPSPRTSLVSRKKRCFDPPWSSQSSSAWRAGCQGPGDTAVW